MPSYSGPVIRNHLKRINFPNHKRYWKFFQMALDGVFGKRQWTMKAEGVYVNGQLQVPASEYAVFLGIAPKKRAVVSSEMVGGDRAPTEKTFESSDDTKEADEPTFKCSAKGCSYIGYTNKALEAHKRRAGH
jgi:hypothetical protein